MKYVNFVKEEDNWSFGELLRVGDGFKECYGFLYMIDSFVFI